MSRKWQVDLAAQGGGGGPKQVNWENLMVWGILVSFQGSGTFL